MFRLIFIYGLKLESKRRHQFISQHLNSQVLQPSCIYQSTKERYGMIPNADIFKTSLLFIKVLTFAPFSSRNLAQA